MQVIIVLNSMLLCIIHRIIKCALSTQHTDTIPSLRIENGMNNESERYIMLWGPYLRSSFNAQTYINIGMPFFHLCIWLLSALVDSNTEQLSGNDSNSTRSSSSISSSNSNCYCYRNGEYMQHRGH